MRPLFDGRVGFWWGRKSKDPVETFEEQTNHPQLYLHEFSSTSDACLLCKLGSHPPTYSTIRPTVANLKRGYPRDRGACLKVWGGGQGCTGAMPHMQAGFYPVMFFIHRKRGGDGLRPLFRCPCNCISYRTSFTSTYLPNDLSLVVLREDVLVVMRSHSLNLALLILALP